MRSLKYTIASRKFELVACYYKNSSSDGSIFKFLHGSFHIRGDAVVAFDEVKTSRVAAMFARIYMPLVVMITQKDRTIM